MCSVAVPPADWFECKSALPRLRHGESFETKQEWTLPNSVFGARAKQCDAGTYWDDDNLLLKAFESDWRRTKATRIITDIGDLGASFAGF